MKKETRPTDEALQSEVSNAERAFNDALQRCWTFEVQTVVKSRQGTNGAPPRVTTFFRPPRKK